MAVAAPLPMNQLNLIDSPWSPVRFGRYAETTSPLQEGHGGSTISLEAALAAIIHKESLLSQSAYEEPLLYRPIMGEFRKSKSFPLLQHPLRSSLNPTRPKVQRSRSVRFADTQGLPLTSVRALTAADPFETEGEIVPYGDLGRPGMRRAMSSPHSTAKPNAPDSSQKKISTRKLKFSQPGTQPDFYARVELQKVCLESARCETRALHGVVRVLNNAFEKEVMVRWTHDHWSSCHDSVCTYCHGSGDGHTDRFAFTLPLNGDDVEFAVCFKSQGQEYWDNNACQNYVITVEH